MSDMPERIWLQGGANDDFAAYSNKMWAVQDWETEPTPYVRASSYDKLADALREWHRWATVNEVQGTPIDSTVAALEAGDE